MSFCLRARRGGPQYAFRRGGGCLDSVADLGNDGIIHFAVKEHPAGPLEETQGPRGDQSSTDHAHRRIEPRPAEEHSARECGDGENGGCCISDDVHIGRPEIEVVMPPEVVVLMSTSCP